MSKSNASQAQIEANRLNAQKSTGPRTAEGKAASSQNAVKHALFRTVLVLEDESQEEFDVLLKEVMDSYEPQNASEALLIEQIVEAHWKIRRLQRAERQLYAKTEDDRTQYLPPKEKAETTFNSAALTLSLVSDSLHPSLMKAQDRLHGTIARAQRELERVRRLRRQADKDAEKGLHEKTTIHLRELRNEANSDASEGGTEVYDEPAMSERREGDADVVAEATPPAGSAVQMTRREPDLRL